MFRYRETMRWHAESSWPFNAGIIARERIPVLHYPHRDPMQMHRRHGLRAAMMARGGRTGDHWRLADWRQDLVAADSGETAAASGGRKEGLAGESGIDAGPLMFRETGAPPPDMRPHQQATPPLRRLAQRLVYATVLPWIDRRRPGFDPAYRPVLIPEEENARIGAQSIPS